MKFNNLFKMSLIASCIWLTACGDGSSDDTETPNTGVNLTINGLATDSPIANGLITARVSGVEEGIEVTADANGNYSIELMLDDSQRNAFISIEAIGTGNQHMAGLVSLIGTVDKLSEDAGEDGVLTAEENFAVTVTNITTAEYGLIKQINEDGEISSDEELEELKKQLDKNEVLQLATAIKVAIDKSIDNADLGLPSEVTNTLELVDNIELTQAYVAEVLNTPEFKEAQEEIFADKRLTDSSDYIIPKQYHMLPISTLHSSIGSFTFNEDGSGVKFETNWSSSYRVAQSNFTWEKSEGEITITLNEAITMNGYAEFDTQILEHSYKVKRFAIGETSDTLQLTTNSRTHYPNGEMEDSESSDTVMVTAIKDNSTVAINPEGTGVAFLTIPVENSSKNNGFLSVYADKFIFNSDGTGSTKVRNKNFVWEKLDGQLIITPDDLDDHRLIVSQLTDNTTSSAIFLTESVDYDTDTLNAGTQIKTIGAGGLLSESLVWNTENVPGIYTYENTVFDNSLQRLWIELDSSGKAITINTFDNNEDGELSSDEIYYVYGKWRINDNGTLTISRLKKIDTGISDQSCMSTNSECFTYHERTWDLISQTDGKYTMLHHHHFMSETGDSETWDTRSLFKVAERPFNIDSPFAVNASSAPSM